MYLISSVLKLLELPHLKETGLVFFGLCFCFGVIFNTWKRLFLNHCVWFLLSGLYSRVVSGNNTEMIFSFFTLYVAADWHSFTLFLFPLAGIKREDDRFSSAASHNRAAREYKSPAQGHCQAQPRWGRGIHLIFQNHLLTKFHKTDPTATKVYLRPIAFFSLLIGQQSLLICYFAQGRFWIKGVNWWRTKV